MSEENKRSIRISVRNLVEFVLRSGDIDNRRSGNAQKDAMLAGGRIHRKIQKRMGSGYRAEVPLKHEVTDDEQEIVLSVEGRADGIFTENGITVIDEIKGMYTDVARLEAPIEVHRPGNVLRVFLLLRQGSGRDPPAAHLLQSGDGGDPAVSDRPLKGRTGTVVFGRGP